MLCKIYKLVRYSSTELDISFHLFTHPSPSNLDHKGLDDRVKTLRLWHKILLLLLPRWSLCLWQLSPGWATNVAKLSVWEEEGPEYRWQLFPSMGSVWGQWRITNTSGLQKHKALYKKAQSCLCLLRRLRCFNIFRMMLGMFWVCRGQCHPLCCGVLGGQQTQ